MAILEKEIWISLSSRNIKHYETLGYEIPKIKSKLGKMQTPVGTKILVKVEDLPKQSNVQLTKICDDCGKFIFNQYFYAILKNRENIDGKDRCPKCVQIFKKNNIPYEKSLEYFALTNDKEYLLSEFSVNNNKTPKDISYGSEDECLWICPKYKHEYEMIVKLRTGQNQRCPYCKGARVLKGFNDLWTTHPYIAKLLKNKQRGYEINAGSHKKEDFQCEHCGFEKKVIVQSAVNQGFSCPRCSDGVSYPEKFVLELLNQLSIDFEFQKTFYWSKNISHINPKLSGDKRYDFYIPFQNTIIEAHGEQHLKQGTRKGIKIRTLEEEQENDRLKEEFAVKNGIENYIVLDCSKSELEYIKNSILLSGLSTMFNLEHIDWLKCHEAACHSLVKTACDLWNQGNKVIEISGIIKLHRKTITEYLKQGKILGWCDYDTKEEMRLNSIANGKAIGKKLAKEVVQLTLDGEFIKYWGSMAQVQQVLGISHSAITNVCKGRNKYAGGFRWMYKEEYEAINNTPFFGEIKYKGKRTVVKLDLNGKFIKEFSSIKEAADEFRQNYIAISRGISKNCRGLTKSAYGFRWMYKEDYEGLLK